MNKFSVVSQRVNSMFQSKRWQQFLDHPAFLINLKSRPERLQSAMTQLNRAGFTHIEPQEAVDAQSAPMAKMFEQHGIQAFDESNEAYTHLSKFPGHQGCILSHLAILKQIIDRNISISHVFEDDIIFHSRWEELAPKFLAKTPNRWDIIYLGSQIEFRIMQAWPPRIQRRLMRLGLPKTLPPWPSRSFGDILSPPLYCTHAFTIKLGAAKSLYQWMTTQKNGAYAIDCMFIDGMRKKPHLSRYPLNWFAWNATRFPPGENQISSSAEFKLRNCGLVFQCEDFGSDIREP
jgi:GR25 family glycosyltransferase involved in LPS biosynthesis